MCMHIKTCINSLLRKINIGKSFRWYLKRYDMALWDWFFFFIAKVIQKFYQLSQTRHSFKISHTHAFVVYCFSLYETALVFVKVIESPKTYTSAHRTHELGFTAHKKFWKSHSDLIVWHKKIIICLLNANCCFLVWAWDFFFSFQCVIYSALPSSTRMSIFRKIALSARKIFKYVAENERRV